MNDRQLTRKLILVVLIKVVLIMGLWWAFVREHKVAVDSSTMAAALNTAPRTPTNTTGDTRHGH